MSNKRFAAHGTSAGTRRAGGSLRLSEPVLVLARAVALIDGVSIEQLVAGLISERGVALGLDALTNAIPESEASP